MSTDDLITRLEAAKTGSRELDTAVGCAAKMPMDWYSSYGYGDPAKDAPREHRHYTTSLDSALTLVPEGWGMAVTNPKHWDAEPNDREPYARVYKVPFDDADEGIFKGTAATPALALCVAALKARQDAKT